MKAKLTDVPRQDGGFTRKFLYTDREMAVIDVSPEAMTMNWSATSAPSMFVDLVERLTGPYEADIALGTREQKSIQETDFKRLRQLLDRSTEAFDKVCAFIRFDLSMTRSVAWQRISEELVVIGYGDSTSEVAHGDFFTLKELMRFTASDQLETDDLSKSFVQLGYEFLHGRAQAD
jgi:hypothetical protein